MLDAVDAIRRYVGEGGLHEGVVYDAVLLRLMQIGEAVKALPPELLAEEPGVPWAQVAGLRDRLAHRYVDTQFSVVEGTVRQDLGGAGGGGQAAQVGGRLRSRTRATTGYRSDEPSRAEPYGSTGTACGRPTVVACPRTPTAAGPATTPSRSVGR